MSMREYGELGDKMKGILREYREELREQLENHETATDGLKRELRATDHGEMVIDLIIDKLINRELLDDKLDTLAKCNDE